MEDQQAGRTGRAGADGTQIGGAMICRHCANAYIPTSDNKREAEGIAIMVRNGYRQCREAKTPENKARWITGDMKCFNPEFLKRKD